jgi:hypothetical protein
MFIDSPYFVTKIYDRGGYYGSDGIDLWCSGIVLWCVVLVLFYVAFFFFSHLSTSIPYPIYLYHPYTPLAPTAAPPRT